MNSITIGQTVPDFEITATGGKTIHLNDYKDKRIVLYFYPKDSTPGCTLQGQDFRDANDALAALNTVVLGVSRDSLRSHENFKTKQCFNFDLLSDTDEQLCTLFDVIKMKNMYGKEVRGIERSTFVIDTQGVLIKEWRKVKVKNHVEEVIEFLKTQ